MILAGQDAVQFLQESSPLLDIERFVIFLADLIDPLVFETGNIVGIQLVRQFRFVLDARHWENASGSPSGSNKIELALHLHFPSRFRGSQNQVHRDADFPEILLKNSEIGFRTLFVIGQVKLERFAALREPALGVMIFPSRFRK